MKRLEGADSWTAIKHTANRKSADGAGPGPGHFRCYRSIRALTRRLPSVSRLKTARLRYRRSSRTFGVSLSLCVLQRGRVVCVCVAAFPRASASVGVKACVCLEGFVVSVVNGCTILITAGTSWSHGPRPLPITRVKHLTLCVPEGLRSDPGP